MKATDIRAGMVIRPDHEGRVTSTVVQTVDINPPGCPGHVHVNFRPGKEGVGTQGECWDAIANVIRVR